MIVRQTSVYQILDQISLVGAYALRHWWIKHWW